MKWLVLFILLVPLVSADFTSVEIKENGAVYVEENLFVNEGTLVLSIPKASYVKVLDESGQKVDYLFENGSLIINGEDEIIVFYVTDMLTEKFEGVWSFKFSSVNSEVQLSLPKGINILKVSPKTSVFEGEDAVKLKFNLENETSILLQYNYDVLVNEEENELSSLFLKVYWCLIGLIIVLFIFVLARCLVKREEKRNLGMRLTKEKEDILKTLTDVQREVVLCLLRKGDLTQNKIKGFTGLPKSTLSRNLKYLQSKQILESKEVGNCNLISLTSWFKEK